jgi:hypothetical protein
MPSSSADLWGIRKHGAIDKKVELIITYRGVLIFFAISVPTTMIFFVYRCSR